MMSRWANIETTLGGVFSKIQARLVQIQSTQLLFFYCTNHARATKEKKTFHRKMPANSKRDLNVATASKRVACFATCNGDHYIEFNYKINHKDTLKMIHQDRMIFVDFLTDFHEMLQTLFFKI